MSTVADRKEMRTMPKPAPISAKPLPPVAVGSPCVVPAMITGGLLWACHFPLALGWLGWIALVPLLTLVRAEASAKRVYWSAYLGGLAFFVPALQWMRVADWRMYATWIALALYCAAYVPAALWLVRTLDRRVRIPLCVSVPLVWVGLEWVRSFLLTGFAWFYLGHAQFRLSMLIQIADLGGVYAISFLVAAVNGWLADVAFAIPALSDRFRWREESVGHASQLRRSTTRVWLSGLAVAGLVIAAVGYGSWRIESTVFSRGPRIALLQTNVPQAVRNNPNAYDLMTMQNTALPFFACLSEPVPELIVWPETSFQAVNVDISKMPTEKVDVKTCKAAAELTEFLQTSFTVTYPTQHLLSMNSIRLDADGGRTRHTTSLLVNDAGAVTHQFDKIHCLPFGEYVPLRDWLPFMKVFFPYDEDFSITAGTKTTRFPLRDLHYGSLICFEDTDASLARQYVQNGPDGKPVDFLVNQSNDGWFGETSEHEEHLITSLFRAIELRRPIVRSANTGISTIIDSTGRVLKPEKIEPEPPGSRPPMSPRQAKAHKRWEELRLWSGIEKWEEYRPSEAIKMWEAFKLEELPPGEYAQFKGCAGVLFATVPLDGRSTIYAQWGDWLPIGCWTTCGAMLLWSTWRGRRAKASRAA